jgi:hypothetical protein
MSGLSQENIVSCYLMGGLGNQLFQIFTTMAYCLRNDKKMVLPYSDILTVGKHRPTYWDSLLSECKPFTAANPENNLTNDELESLPVYKEPYHHYKGIPNIQQNFRLYGYFQSPKYFEDQKEEIIARLKIREQQAAIRAEYHDFFDADHDTISLHFRGGDYKKNLDYHPIMPYEYYENALFNIFMYRPFTKRYKVLLFCELEDNEIVDSYVKRLRVKYEYTILFVKVSEYIPDWKQLLIMSCCNNNIIANSSFSWWAGYLNENPGKFVCYPHIWFGTKAKNEVCDMFPITWNHIKF